MRQRVAVGQHVHVGKVGLGARTAKQDGLASRHGGERVSKARLGRRTGRTHLGPDEKLWMATIQLEIQDTKMIQRPHQHDDDIIHDDENYCSSETRKQYTAYPY